MIEKHFATSDEMSREKILEVIEGRYAESSERMLEDVKDDNLERNFYYYNDKDRLNILMAATGVKKGSVIVATVEKQAEESLIETLQSMGLDCYTCSKTEELKGRKVGSEAIYMTRDRSYREETPTKMPFIGSEDVSKEEAERKFGRFLGYPEAEIEAFVEEGSWPEGYERENGKSHVKDYEEGTDYVFSSTSLAREHGYPKEKIGKLDSFTNFMVKDRKQSIENAIKIAEEREKQLKKLEQEHDVDILKLMRDI